MVPEEVPYLLAAQAQSAGQVTPTPSVAQVRESVVALTSATEALDRALEDREPLSEESLELVSVGLPLVLEVPDQVSEVA